jgi:hypothetical protein
MPLLQSPKPKLYFLVLLFFFSGLMPFAHAYKDQKRLYFFDEYANRIYKMLGEAELSPETFRSALKGYFNLQEKKMLDNNMLTIVDYSKSCNQKRFFVIDLAQKKVLYKSLVAHGRNSGATFARDFSNQHASMKSSLGFFVTGETFNGQHGNSLRLDGVEANINDNARDRGIIIHAADYVSEGFVKKYGRLGRSLGCPALPNHLNDSIINKIKDKSCVFVYYPDHTYLRKSSIINQTAYATPELALMAGEAFE